MLELQRVIAEQMEGEKDGIVTTRLLVPTSKISCLIGTGRSTIEDMRRATRANIRLLPKDHLPPCASIEEDELVEIMGDTTVAREALIEVLGRLCNNASASVPVSGGRGVRDDGRSSSSPQRYNCSSDSCNFGGRMGPRSLCRGVPSISGLHSPSSSGRHSSPVVGGEEKSQGINLDSIRWEAMAEKIVSSVRENSS